MYKQLFLKNNLRLLAAPLRGLKTATILVIVGTGSRHEEKENNGISHFLEHLFFKGTKKRPDTASLAGELDRIGGEYNAFTGKEYTGFWVKAEAGKMEKVLEILSDMLLNSKLSEEEIKREKGVIIEEMNMYHDNPLLYIEDVFEELLYGDQPAGWDTIGRKENILRFKRKDLQSYFKTQYSASRSVICLAGDLRGNFKSWAEKYFGRFAAGSFKEKIIVRESQARPQTKIHFKKTDQAHLSLGVRTCPLGDKDEFAVKFLSVLLGGSMGSRLFLNLRERNGLAYYVRTSAEFYSDCGYLTTQAGVPVGKLDLAIKIILGEYKKVKNIFVSASELERNKDLIAGRLAIQSEASDNIANWYGRQAVLREKIITPAEYLKKMKALKSSDLKKAAVRFFKEEHLNLAAIGPFAATQEKEIAAKLKF